MKPGRLPESHPDEQAARDKLRALSPEALRKMLEQRELEPTSTTTPVRQAPVRQRRWT